MFSIGITTFSKRIDLVISLVGKIRMFTSCDILIAINGDYDKDFNEDYRKKILELCLTYTNIYPIFFPEQRGLAKLWNTLIVHSKQEWIFIINDDIEITSGEMFDSFIPSVIDKPDIYIVNGTFCHFLVHKDKIDELGYFDERFLGFGEEDWDMIHRYIEKYQFNIEYVYVGGVVTVISSLADDNIRGINGYGKYSDFNCYFRDQKYRPDNEGIKSNFQYPVVKVIDDIKQYPYENFFKLNKHKLKK